MSDFKYNSSYLRGRLKCRDAVLALINTLDTLNDDDEIISAVEMKHRIYKEVSELEMVPHPALFEIDDETVCNSD